MPRKGWKNVALPEEIIAIVDKVVKNSKFGFRSRTDLVLEAVKDKLRELKNYP